MEKGVRESLSPEDQEYSMEMQYMMDLLIPGCWNEYLSFGVHPNFFFLLLLVLSLLRVLQKCA